MHTAIDNPIGLDTRTMVHKHLNLLGHAAQGVTELRVFEPLPPVVYADSADAIVRLCLEMDGRVRGVYVGVQPRPPHLFDLASNRWVPARGGPDGNCACDSDIEYITAVFFDIDVVSDGRAKGHPASDEELVRSLRAAQLLSREEGLAMNSTICSSGNGHYVLAPIVPVPLYSNEEAAKFRQFCIQPAARVAAQVSGVKFDPVYNLSRVMRIMGTLNRKGQPSPGQPHRRAHFVTEPAPAKSMALHYMIVNTDIDQTATAGPARSAGGQDLPAGLRCDLSKIEQCEFIQWCRRHPQEVSEPQWFGLISNLAHLQGGIELIHEISRLDGLRYDYADTQRVIERVLRQGYKPVGCRTIMSSVMVRPGRGIFQCSQIAGCPARAPMYLAASHTVYTR